MNTNGGGSAQNLAFVTDHQGSVRAAIRADGNRENDAVYFARGAFGNLEGATTSGEGSTQTNTQTGYTGASTPNAGGGFTYLRNRWYDPATGRFLTQDPIGLAGGVNLYAYAGNNPVSFSDPFGLCPPEDNRNGPECIIRRLLLTVAEVSDNAFRKINSVLQFAPGASAVEFGTGRNFQGEPLSGGERALSGAFAALDLFALGGGGGGRVSRGVLRNVDGGVATIGQALDGAVRWLGEGYQEISSGVFRSSDNTRQFRMTSSDLLDRRKGPHVHFEAVGADGRTITENAHVRLVPE